MSTGKIGHAIVIAAFSMYLLRTEAEDGVKRFCRIIFLTNHFPFVGRWWRVRSLWAKGWKTDVLVVGGGLAGNNGAIGALEKRRQGPIADKSSIDRLRSDRRRGGPFYGLPWHRHLGYKGSLP